MPGTTLNWHAAQAEQVRIGLAILVAMAIARADPAPLRDSSSVETFPNVAQRGVQMCWNERIYVVV